MQNASCCGGSNKNEEKASCCNQIETADCCRKKDLSEGGVIDLVCGMKVNPTEATFHTEYDGKMYYFCNIACKESFMNDPKKYLDTDNS